MRGRSRADRVYRFFLRLFPSEFRGDFGDDMSDVFRDERAEAATGGRLALFRLWSRTLRGFASVAPREHAQILVRDAAYGLRLMRKHPVTTAAAMFSIALGVGANTAMFTVVNAVLLQFPFKDPERVVTVLRQTPRGRSAGFTEAQLRAWAGRVDSLDSLSGYSMLSPILTGAGSATRLRLECVSASMFATLGVSPGTGRTFTEHEDGPAGEPVIVVSHGFWAGGLNRDPNVIGRTLTLDGAAATVIGVMPEAFDGPRALRRLDGWIPLTFCLARQRAEGRQLRIVNLYARLKPDVSPRLAEAQMDAAVEGAAAADEPIRVHLSPLIEEIAGDVREPLLALLGAAGFVLLIACANVASLLIGRADARRRELAVRTALGCTRARIVRQLLTESVLFALCGGAAGLLIANWSLGTLLSVMPGYIRRIDHIALDGRVLAACVVLSTATGLLFGLLPALYASRVSPGPALKESGRWATPSRRLTRGALIVAEIALSLALLTGAGLVMKTFLHLRPADPGFEPEGKLAMTISLPRSRYPDGPSQAAFLENLRQRLRDRPGVESVVATSYLPLSGFVSTADVQLGGRDARSVTVHTPHVTADYFAEMGIPIVRGRAFTESDGPGADVAIVNETMALRMWPGRDPLGQTLLFKSATRETTKTIVGIARDVRDSGHRLTSAAELFVTFANEPVPVLRVVVKTPYSVERMTPVIRAEVSAIDPGLPIGDVERVADITARSVATWRFAASLMATFAVVAVSLAAVGLFAVVGCWVTERTAEIGVRMALGAGRGAVLRLFLARGAVLGALGLACGLALAALTTRFLGGWLVDASPLDRPTFAGAAALMGAVCLLAAYLAARRAATIDPLIALRAD